MPLREPPPRSSPRDVVQETGADSAAERRSAITLTRALGTHAATGIALALLGAGLTGVLTWSDVKRAGAALALGLAAYVIGFGSAGALLDLRRNWQRTLLGSAALAGLGAALVVGTIMVALRLMDSAFAFWPVGASMTAGAALGAAVAGALEWAVLKARGRR